MKILGVVLLLLGAAGIGVLASAQLRHRVTVLRSLKESFAYMERELSFRCASMGEMMGYLGKCGPAPAKLLFARCYGGLVSGQKPNFQDLWNRSVACEETLSLCAKGVGVLGELGSVLGRYDSEDQCKALKRAQDELGECLQMAENECRRLGKVYTTLGLGSGIMLVILLL